MVGWLKTFSGIGLRGPGALCAALRMLSALPVLRERMHARMREHVSVRAHEPLHAPRTQVRLMLAKAYPHSPSNVAGPLSVTRQAPCRQRMLAGKAEPIRITPIAAHMTAHDRT